MKQPLKLFIMQISIWAIVNLLGACQSNDKPESSPDNTSGKETEVTMAEYRAEHARHITPKYNGNVERLTVNCNACNDLCIPEACMWQGNANNPQCQAEIANLHQVDEALFNDMIEDYYGEQPTPNPLTKTRQYVDSLTNVNARLYRITFDLKDGTGGDISTHDNMQLARVEGWERPVDEMNSYSISLFRGILNLPDVQTFKFYRGKTCNTHMKTLMISAYNSSGQPVYFGDLTDAYPLHHISDAK